MPAQAGDPYARLRPLFQFDPPRRAAKPPPRKAAAPPRSKAKARPAASTSRRGAAVALPEKAADARLVLVVGDVFGQALAEGLAETFAGEPSVRVESAARARAGLVRSEAAALLPEAARPAAIVAMLGANDRRPFQPQKDRLPFRSPGWNAAYAARAADLAQAAAERKVPLLWVGLPAVASSKASADFLAFNEIYRTAAGAGGGAFVDTWDGFVDEAGGFVTFGPGVSGQKVRLRTKDGIGFTPAGRRKLAFFVARPLAKLLDLPLGLDAAAGDALPAGRSIGPGRTEPLPLSGYVLRTGEAGELLGGSPAAGTGTPAGENRMLFDPPAVRGRADDFSVPR